jgi:hypothetical protein
MSVFIGVLVFIAVFAFLGALTSAPGCSALA